MLGQGPRSTGPQPCSEFQDRNLENPNRTRGSITMKIFPSTSDMKDHSFSPSFLTLTAGSWAYLNRTPSGKRSSVFSRCSPTLEGCPHHHHLHQLAHRHHNPLKTRAYTLCLVLFLLTFLVAVRLLFLEHPIESKPLCSDPSRRLPPVLHRGLGDSTTAVLTAGKTSIIANKQPTIGVVTPKSNVRFPRTKRRLPQCLIIGVRKSGTRALLEFLDVHPGVQKAPIEVHFFNQNDRYKLGLEWYRRKMPFSFPGQITVEKTPAYFTTESVPERVKLMNSSIKLLLIVKDPVTRLVSDYVQILSNKISRDKLIPSFEEVVLLPGKGQVDISFKAVRTSIYILYFRRWLAAFPRNQILVVNGDNLIVDPYGELERVERFLGLPARIEKDSFYFNRTKGFFCVRNGTADKCLNETKGRKHPEVSAEVMRKLRKFYAPYNRDFYRATGRDFGWPDE